MYNQMIFIDQVQSKLRLLKVATEAAIPVIASNDGWSELPGEFLKHLHSLVYVTGAFLQQQVCPALAEAHVRLQTLADDFDKAIAIPVKVEKAKEINDFLPDFEAASRSFTPKPSPVHDRSCRVYR